MANILYLLLIDNKLEMKPQEQYILIKKEVDSIIGNKHG